MRAILRLILGSVVPAFACLGPMSETRTFFESLPAKLRSKEVVAQVEVISTRVSAEHEGLTEVKVVAAIRGIKAGAKIVVGSDPLNSCNHDPELKPGARYFVAGALDSTNVLRGSWKQGDLIESP